MKKKISQKKNGSERGMQLHIIEHALNNIEKFYYWTILVSEDQMTYCTYNNNYCVSNTHKA